MTSGYKRRWKMPVYRRHEVSASRLVRCVVVVLLLCLSGCGDGDKGNRLGTVVPGRWTQVASGDVGSTTWSASVIETSSRRCLYVEVTAADASPRASLLDGDMVEGRPAVCAGKSVDLFAPVAGFREALGDNAMIFGLVSPRVRSVVLSAGGRSLSIMPRGLVVAADLPGDVDRASLVLDDGSTFRRCQIIRTAGARALLCSG